MRHPLLWIVGLLAVGIAAYWLLERHRQTPPKTLGQVQAPPPEPQNPAPNHESFIIDSVDSLSSSLSSSTPSSPPSSKPSQARTVPESTKIESFFSLDYISARSFLSCQAVRHRYYLLCYVEEHEQPSWTAYVLEGAKLREGRLRRTQDFREDPQVRTQSATLSDYRRSGYDRGHLVPAGDFKWDSIGMSETFYLSNMSPQLHEFNAGIWEAIERTVRTWAREKKRLVIYTGPVLRPGLPKIGKGVSVPDSFYKVVYSLSGSEVQAVGFLVPHRAFSEGAVTRFMVPVDSVEKMTGIDFFPTLPDDVEERAESRWNKAFWSVRFTKR